jgi:hypothetical protein
LCLKSFPLQWLPLKRCDDSFFLCFGHCLIAFFTQGKSTMPLPVCEVVLDPGSPIPVGSPSHVHSQPAAAMPNSSFVVDPSGAAFATTVKPLPPLATTGLVSNAGLSFSNNHELFLKKKIQF